MPATLLKTALALLPALAATTAFAQTLPSADEAALRQLVGDIRLAINQLDIARYTTLLAEDIVAIEPDGEFRSRSALVQRMRQATAGKSPGNYMPRNEPVLIRALGPGHAQGINHWEFAPPGFPPASGTTLWTAVKTDGRWVFHSWAVAPKMPATNTP
ncbi:MAG: nuclear transport factor 2 family protein [Burkholderiales bacterium]|nr:nuclear transport factor 2 family protein [Burkholderiales bacterium]